MKKKNEVTYRTFKWYEGLIFFLSGILDYTEKAKNSFDSGLKYLDNSDLKKGNDKQYRMEIDLVHALVSVSIQCLNTVVIKMATIAAELTEKRILNLRSQLIKAGDPRVRVN